MSLRRSIVANSASQLYAVAIGILFVPLYVRYMGIEAYGLVGIYTMLQGWFVLLDLGLTPTVTRETARFNGGAIGALELRRLFRALEGIFVTTAIAGALFLIAISGVIATNWITVEAHHWTEVQRALCLMAVVVSLRWVCGLYRGAITGFEDIVWLSGVTGIVATVRFALIVPFLMFVGATPTYFFAYQLAVALLEVTILVARTYRLFPPVPVRGIIPWQWAPVRPVLRFALSAAFTSAVWVFVTNTDKLILSGMVSLTDYAYFTLAVLVASGIAILSSPIGAAILPRLTNLNAQGDEDALVRRYREATQIVLVVCAPVVLMLALFSEPILMAWTNQPGVAHNAAPILSLYAIGNGLLTLLTIPYYLQIARGNLTLHVIYNVVFVILFAPLLVLAVSRFGMIGAGYAWIIANLFPVLVWLPVVHRRFLPGMHMRWLTRDVLAVVALPVGAALAARYFIVWPPARIWLFVELLLVYGVLVLLAACSSSAIGGRLKARLANSAFLESVRRSRAVGRARGIERTDV